jgi:hypothetical protein
MAFLFVEIQQMERDLKKKIKKKIILTCNNKISNKFDTLAA